jgi:hypothetical protein
LFEQLRARRARARYERRLRAWQAERGQLEQLLELAREFSGEHSDEIALGPHEKLFFRMSGVSLIEERVVGGHYDGGYSGLSIPVGRIGGRALSCGFGAHRGHYVHGEPVPTVIDTGDVFLTNRRVIFIGAGQTRECRFARLIGVKHDELEGSTSLSSSSRQRPVTIAYGPELSSAVCFWLELAQAHYRRGVAAVIAELEARLAQLDDERPLHPLSFAGGIEASSTRWANGQGSAQQANSRDRDVALPAALPELGSSGRGCEWRLRREP